MSMVLGFKRTECNVQFVQGPASATTFQSLIPAISGLKEKQ